MSDERIIKAIINGTRSGKIKWEFSNHLSARARFGSLSLRFEFIVLAVDGAPLTWPATELYCEFLDAIKSAYREDEEFEASIMELEAD